MKKLKQLLFGVAATGLPVTAIKTSVHTVMPDKVLDYNSWMMTNNVSAKVQVERH